MNGEKFVDTTKSSRVEKINYYSKLMDVGRIEEIAQYISPSLLGNGSTSDL